MNKNIFDYMEDTIAAVSTALGNGAIAIVRLSGKDAVSIVDGVFRSRSGKSLSDIRKRSVITGYILDLPSGAGTAKDGETIIDEALVVVMRAPNSYTGEDMVEINCHGGMIVVNGILDIMVKRGCRIADKGEFTRRAFLNGKIDLVQAEAVADIIDAKTRKGLGLAMEQLMGSVSQKIVEIDSELIEVLSHIEALIDFPDEDIPGIDIRDAYDKLQAVINKEGGLIDSFDKGIKIRRGVGVVICGRRNVGKSSILNALSKDERAIVTSVAGTTRDIVSQEVHMNGVMMTLFDTAGFGISGDFIEQEGMRRSQAAVDKADFLLFVIDGSSALQDEDIRLFERLSDKRKIIVINKADLDMVTVKEDITRYAGPGDSIEEVSALTGLNISLLEEEIVKRLTHGEISIDEDAVISNIRHRDLLVKSRQQLVAACNNIKSGLSIEFIADDIKEALEPISEILGRSVTDDILGRIFEKFCIGK